MAAGIALSYFKGNTAILPVLPSPSAGAAPTPSPSPSLSPSPSPSPEAAAEAVYSSTVILLDGVPVGTVASREAAELLINEAVSLVEARITEVGIPSSTIENTVQLVASEFYRGEKTPLYSYDDMLALLTGEGTPLRVATELVSRERTTDEYTVVETETASLVEGTRIIVSMGVTGESETNVALRYINGVREGESESETVEITGRADEVVLVGSAKPDPNAVPGRSEGEKGPDKGELRFAYPTKSGKITANFGQLAGILHLGVDFAVENGETVFAPCGGTVVSVMERGGYGLTVELDHGGGFTTRYAHLSAATVSLGDEVAAGDAIALAGASGSCDGPELHFELRQDGIAYNPRYYFD